MRKYFFAAILFICAKVHAQNCQANYLGTKTLYSAPQKKFAQPPQDYKAVFINHVGRHGARHLTKDVAASFCYQILKRADSLHALTAEGKNLLSAVLKLEKVEKKDFESISYEGKKEQQEIATRMVANFPTVFENRPAIVKVTVAKKVRTSQSADAFLSGLKEKINIDGEKKNVDDTILRFYDLSPAYLEFQKDGKWQQQLSELKHQKKNEKIGEDVTGKFFTPNFSGTLSGEDKEKFADDIFGFLAITYSLNKEIEDAGYKTNDVDFSSFITCSEAESLNNINEAEDFLVKGPGTNVSGIQVRIAAPLLVNFIKTTDEFIAGKKVNAQLRFSHAETVAPFAALLRLEGASQSVTKPEKISSVWKASEVIPLSANIQWILYQKPGSEEYLIKFLLNEKEVGIEGLKTKNYPYYKWSDVRIFYIKKLQSINADLTENGYKYLQGLK